MATDHDIADVLVIGGRRFRRGLYLEHEPGRYQGGLLGARRMGASGMPSPPAIPDAPDSLDPDRLPSQTLMSAGLPEDYPAQRVSETPISPH